MSLLSAHGASGDARRLPRQERVDGPAACAMRKQQEKSARDGEVLLEVKKLVAIAQLRVKEHGRRNTEDREQQCRYSGLPAEQDQHTAAKLERDGEGEELLRHAECAHVGRRGRIRG